jgi:hypothetical protein
LSIKNIIPTLILSPNPSRQRKLFEERSNQEKNTLNSYSIPFSFSDFDPSNFPSFIFSLYSSYANLSKNTIPTQILSPDSSRQRKLFEERSNQEKDNTLNSFPISLSSSFFVPSYPPSFIFTFYIHSATYFHFSFF